MTARPITNGLLRGPNNKQLLKIAKRDYFLVKIVYGNKLSKFREDTINGELHILDHKVRVPRRR